MCQMVNTYPGGSPTKKPHFSNIRFSDISIPLHVIPLVISSAFLIVTEFSTYVVSALDIISGNGNFRNVAFPSNDQREGL